jgi:acetyl esterase/lipase
VADFLVPVTEAMLEETRRVNAEVEAQLATVPSVHTLEPAVTRAEREAGRGWSGPVMRSERAVTRTIPGPGGPISLRMMLPQGDVGGVFLHIHGGGWVLGAADQQDLLLVAVADLLGLAAVSVEYRLAPEHPFPAAPDDCEHAASWLVEHAEAEFGTRRWGERNLVLSTPIMAWFSSLFTPDMSDDERRSPEVSPLYADLRDMPPALFTVGTLDPLLDDSLFMAARWRAAGNDAELRVFPEAPHGFIRFPTAVTGLALDAMLAFLLGALAG